MLNKGGGQQACMLNKGGGQQACMLNRGGGSNRLPVEFPQVQAS